MHEPGTDDQLKHRPSKNALLSDITISTSAAPTFFPAHYFETKDDKGETRAFNLVDGGLAANNPVSASPPHAYTIAQHTIKLQISNAYILL